VARRQQILKVEVPAPESDNLRLGRVGIIALIGFLLGVLWPRLAGVRLVPAVPEDERAAATAPAAAKAASASSAPPASKASHEREEADGPPSDVVDRLALGKSTVTSCRDAAGRRRDECDAIDLDPLIKPKLLALAQCPTAKTASGMLSLGFEVDFEKNLVSDIQKGKSTTMAEGPAERLVECAIKLLSGISIEGIAHQHVRYTLFYPIDLAPPRTADGEGEATPASGRATVSWQVALIRSEPKDGDVVARVLQGTRVLVTGRKGDWYRVKYDAKGNEGWVFRSAIGL
jgi:hypothetical protein